MHAPNIESFLTYLHSPWTIALIVSLVAMLSALALIVHMRKTSDIQKINHSIAKYSLAHEKNIVGSRLAGYHG